MRLLDEDWLGGAYALGQGWPEQEFRFMTEVEVEERLETGRYLYEEVPSTGQVAGVREVARVARSFVRAIRLGMYMPGVEEPCGMVAGLVLYSRGTFQLEYVQRFPATAGLEGGRSLMLGRMLYHGLSCVVCAERHVKCADSSTWGSAVYASNPGPTHVFVQEMDLPDYEY